jgi:hypothetical protein
MCKKHHQGSYHVIGSYAVRGNKCGCDNPNGYPESDHVIYSGPNLPCSGVNTSDALSIALQKMDAKLCELQTELFNSSTTTTTTTA